MLKKKIKIIIKMLIIIIIIYKFIEYNLNWWEEYAKLDWNYIEKKLDNILPKNTKSNIEEKYTTTIKTLNKELSEGKNLNGYAYITIIGIIIGYLIYTQK